MNPSRRPEWQALQAHQQGLAATDIASLFAQTADRTQRWTLRAAGLEIDCSRHRATEETRQKLVALARATEVEAWRERLFAGAPINTTEGRAAWHTALRTPPADAAVARQIADERDRMLAFVDALRARHVMGSGGQPIERVVALGIGGSDLGPRLVVDALAPAHTPVDLRFVTNIDPVDLNAAIAGADAQRTLFVVISKSFSTLETLENAKAAQQWLAAQLGAAAAAQHLAAVTSKPEAARALGIADDRIFTFADWVGGRYSLWSNCGLPIALACGAAVYRDLLAGAAAMDEHSRSAPLQTNAPVQLALLGLWYTNFWNVQTRVVVPYVQRLQRLPAYLQQLEMESNGKRVDRDGQVIDYSTAPIVWGDVGTNVQHSFFQWLHQAPQWAPVDFVTNAQFIESAEPRERLLQQFAQVQMDALAFGDAAVANDSARALYAQCPGNRPSTEVRLPRLDAQAVGALIALYEHRTFVQGVLWNINSFDQWGVELGKRLLAQRRSAR